MGRTYQSTVVSAPIAEVWSLLRDFHNLDWAQGVIESVEAVGDRAADQVGATRSPTPSATRSPMVPRP